MAKISYRRGLHKKAGEAMLEIIKKFRLQEVTGLNLAEIVVLLQDLVEIQARNLSERERFLQTRKRALFLPHCSRKYMDSRCKATFNADLPTYVCAHCSPDCLINKTVTFAEIKGYDVYILPGGSCVAKILSSKHYDGVVGVACGEEIKISGEALKNLGVAGQAVPLIKNGCANTLFNVETLFKTL
ncbi:MAG: DUF116 domain-containing protein [Candidatus Bathyarchaeales archaeon]